MLRWITAILILASFLPEAGATGRSDTLARALATFWGSAFKTDDLDARGRKEFVRGLREVLKNDSIGRNAYMRGATMGINVLGGFEQMEQLGMTADRDVLINSLIAVAEGKSVGFTTEEAGSYIDSQIDARQSEAFSPASQEAFIREAAATEGAVTTASGLVFKVLTEGEGPMPAEGSKVRLLYTGMLSDGTVFDETDEPTLFDTDRFVTGLTEGIRLMKPGGTYELHIPASLAYGDSGAAGVIPPGAALRFIVKLVSIE